MKNYRVLGDNLDNIECEGMILISEHNTEEEALCAKEEAYKCGNYPKSMMFHVVGISDFIQEIINKEEYMNKTIYGFACAQTQVDNGWAVWPATLEGDALSLHDLSGLGGKQLGKPCDIFYPSETGEALCKVAMKKANEKVAEMNKLNEEDESEYTIPDILRDEALRDPDSMVANMIKMFEDNSHKK